MRSLTTARPALLALTLMLALRANALAQDQRVILTPVNAPRWEIAGYAGWYGLSRPDSAVSGQWLDTGAGSLSLAYYWTQHLKTELDVSLAGHGQAYSQEVITLPSPPAIVPATIFRLREHRYRDRTVGAALIYQPLENRWAHPFIGLGVGIVHEDRRIQSADSRYYVGVPPVTLPAPPILTDVSYRVEPQAVGGFKFYVAEQAFIRTDARFGFSRDGLSTALWRVGVGVDF